MRPIERIGIALREEYAWLTNEQAEDLATVALQSAKTIADEGGSYLDPVVYESASLFLEAMLGERDGF